MECERRAREGDGAGASGGTLLSHMDPKMGAAILAHLLVQSAQPPAQEPEPSRGGEAGAEVGAVSTEPSEAGAVSTEPESEAGAAGAVSTEPVRWLVFISAFNYK